MEREKTPIKVVTIPNICCLVMGALKTKNARITNRTGLAPAIGATSDVKPLLMPKLKLNSATLTINVDITRGTSALLTVGFERGIERILMKT